MFKLYVCIALAIIAACCVGESPELPNNAVTHAVIGRDQTGVTYRYNEKAQGLGYVESCYGSVINIYRKSTDDINPATDAPWVTMNISVPIYEIPLNHGWYYGFFVPDKNNAGPDGINGAVDIAVTNDGVEPSSIVPRIPDKVVGIKIAMSSGVATLTWKSTGTDNTFVYRKDVPMSQYTPAAWFPPPNYYCTACSAKYWMTKDDTATGKIKITGENGVVQVDGINDKTVTLVAITTEMKVPNAFATAYDFVALGAASTTIISTVALILLVFSVLVI